jgi:hypothetical protein
MSQEYSPDAQPQRWLLIPILASTLSGWGVNQRNRNRGICTAYIIDDDVKLNAEDGVLGRRNGNFGAGFSCRSEGASARDET